jgi:GTPase SAR1 family protein
MLSFKRGNPVARIVGGKCNGKILKVHDGTNIDEDYTYNVSKLERYDKEHLKLLKDALDKDNPEWLTGDMRKIFTKIKNRGDMGNQFKDDNCLCKIIPTDDPDQRDSIYITGPSGSGKSTFVSQFMEEYRKKYPDRPIWLFSSKPDDPALDVHHPDRVPLTDHMVDEPITLDELEQSLVIFDDIDQIRDKAIQNAVWGLRDSILELGRSKGISICTVSHQITNYKATRICLNESDYVVMFPKSGAKYQMNYFLRNYAGMSKEDIKKVFGLNSRAVILKKSYPMCVIHKNGVYVV